MEQGINSTGAYLAEHVFLLLLAPPVSLDLLTNPLAQDVSNKMHLKVKECYRDFVECTFPQHCILTLS